VSSSNARNKKEMVEQVQEALGSSATLKVADFENMTFAAQVELVRQTDVLFGAHGAGLTHILFLQVECTKLFC
jgi:capsular polysaccharide biosynthesis protein